MIFNMAGLIGSADPTLQSKTATPTKSAQTITPDDGYDGLSSVTVNPIPSQYNDTSAVTATASDVASGKIIVDASGNQVTGTAVFSSGFTFPEIDVISETASMDGILTFELNGGLREAFALLIKTSADKTYFLPFMASDVAHGSPYKFSSITFSSSNISVSTNTACSFDLTTTVYTYNIADSGYADDPNLYGGNYTIVAAYNLIPS